jgi:hypothetical protein
MRFSTENVPQEILKLSLKRDIEAFNSPYLHQTNWGILLSTRAKILLRILLVSLPIHNYFISALTVGKNWGSSLTAYGQGSK